MKKVLALLLTLSTCLSIGFIGCGESETPETETPPVVSPTPTPEPEEPEEPEEPTPIVVNDELVGKTGTVTIDASAGGEIKVFYNKDQGTVLGGSGLVEAVIDGGEGEEKPIMYASENCEGDIKGYGMSTLTFKNLTFQIGSDVLESGGSRSYGYYIEFGGKLRFENCVFNDSIWLYNADAQFVNCTINCDYNPIGEDKYGVWVNDGSATFTNCTFTGIRAVKIHEFSSSENVEKVIFDTCIFYYIKQKPGIAIGTVDANTEIVCKNSLFEGCASGNKGEEDEVGFFETDTALSSFTFTYKNQNNLVDGRPIL